MDNEIIAAIVIPLIGLLIAGLQLAFGNGPSRLQRLASQSQQLWDLHEIMREAGPLLGDGSRGSSITEHDRLLLRLQIEARVEAASFVARLEKSHGSYSWGILWIAYSAVMMLSLTTTGNSGPSYIEYIAQAQLPPLARLIGLLLLALPVGLFIYGWRQVVRRGRLRYARIASGVTDEVTLEDIRDTGSKIRSFFAGRRLVGRTKRALRRERAVARDRSACEDVDSASLKSLGQ